MSWTRLDELKAETELLHKQVATEQQLNESLSAKCDRLSEHFDPTTLYCEPHLENAPGGPCPCCAAVEIERLKSLAARLLNEATPDELIEEVLDAMDAEPMSDGEVARIMDKIRRQMDEDDEEYE